MFYFVIFIQTAINTGVGIGSILLAGECLQVLLLLVLLLLSSSSSSSTRSVVEFVL